MISMNAPDTLKRLEGEPEIPSLTPRSSSSHKPIIAVSVLALSLVGALGFAATRYFGKKDVPPEAAVDVASATVTKLKFQDPPPAPVAVPAVKAIPVAEQTRVPSIEADLAAPATAIPVRGTAGGRPTKQPVPASDESPFGPSGAGGGSAVGTVNAGSR